jgi:hypothetical protein
MTIRREATVNNLAQLNLPTDRVLFGTAAMWTAETKWIDRDRLPIPLTPKLVLGMRTILRRWLDRKPIDITEHPLPNVDALNAAIPRPWPAGLNGREEPPYAVHYVVYFCDLQDGAPYTFVNKTYGAKLACEQLKEKITVMRALRGAQVVPVVQLDQLPMKTENYGTKWRPHFHVVDWKVPASADGNSDAQLPSQPPQLSATPAPKPAASAAPAATFPLSRPATRTASALDQMKSPKPVTTGEIINDEVPF